MSEETPERVNRQHYVVDHADYVLELQENSQIGTLGTLKPPLRLAFAIILSERFN